MFEIGKQLLSLLLGWIPEVIMEGRKTGMRKTSYLVILLFVSLPAVAVYGAVTLAKADDLEALSDRLDMLSESVESKISNIQSNVNTLIKIQLSGELRDLKRRVCANGDQLDRNSLNGEIDRVQDQYRDITGGAYTIPPCAEL
jgi:hypothetical protein